MENVQLKIGQKIFGGVLVEFQDVVGKKKSDGTPFHFGKVNVDLELINSKDEKYTKLAEFTVDPDVFVGVELKKYARYGFVFEMTNPLSAPKLVKIIANV